MSKTVNPIRLAIAIPTYNETKNISHLINGIETIISQSDVPCTVLVIDDTSPDGTGVIVQQLAKTMNRQNFTVQLLQRRQKAGLSKAYIHGFRELMKTDCSHILQMDADLSHDPKYIATFIEQAALGADFVVGSRYIVGGNILDWAWYRKVLSRFGNTYARYFLGNKIHDYTGGYNLYATTLLQKIDLSSLQASGYGFLIELKYRALRHAKHVKEIPIVFVDRQNGQSKIPHSTIIKNLWLVPRLALTERKTTKRMKAQHEAT